MLDQPRTDIAVLIPIELRFISPHPARVLRDCPGGKFSNEVKGAVHM